MAHICICGVGNAGLPLSLMLSEAEYHVTGYDVDEARIDALERNFDPSGSVESEVICQANVKFSSDPTVIESADYVLITVPTPVSADNTPDMRALRAIGRDIGRHLDRETTIVLESTVYPGGTREVLVPEIRKTSGLTVEEDYRIGYSPERLVPGQSLEELRKTVKLIGAQDEETADDLESMYGAVFESIHRTPTIEAAEAAKCLENTQRDVNIALINEFAMACNDDSDLDWEPVLEAAATKWNFHRYDPGIVGGQCIPVDPYYLIYRLEEERCPLSMMRTAREVNSRLVDFVVDLILRALHHRRQELDQSGSVAIPGGSISTDGGGSEESVLLAGMTYKPNSAIVEPRPLRRVVERLEEAGLAVAGYDPHADRQELAETYEIPAQEELSVSGYTALAVLTPHDAFTSIDVADLGEEMTPMPVFVDLHGVTNGDERADSEYVYRSL